MRNSRISRGLILFFTLLPQAENFVRAQDPGITVTLIGTGGPELTQGRSGSATLIRAKGEYLLFDAGRNILDRLYATRNPPQMVTRVFLTHLHNDHIEGLPTLWLTPWFLLGRTAKMRVWGPASTAAMIEGMRQMYAHDLAHRPNAVLKREYLDVEAHEIAGGLVYSENGIDIRAIAVEHADGNPAFAYRVNAAGHSVFLTGDATLTEGLAAAAQGVDLLISNVAAGTRTLEVNGSIDPILAKLMRPEQAAQLFAFAHPRLAIFSHMVKKELPGSGGDRTILRRTREAGYSGPLRMGLDGMVITIAAKIRVELPNAHARLPDFDGPKSKF